MSFVKKKALCKHHRRWSDPPTFREAKPPVKSKGIELSPDHRSALKRINRYVKRSQDVLDRLPEKYRQLLWARLDAAFAAKMGQPAKKLKEKCARKYQKHAIQQKKKKSSLKRALRKERIRLGLYHGGGSAITPGFMHDQIYARLRRELDAYRRGGDEFGEHSDSDIFYFLRTRLTKMGEQYGYDVKIRSGIVRWINRETGYVSYVFGINSGQKYWLANQLWRHRRVFRTEIIYNEIDPAQLGAFAGWVLQHDAPMNIMNLTDRKKFLKRVRDWNEKAQVFADSEAETFRIRLAA